MEMSGALPDTFDEGYIHQFKPEPTHTWCNNYHKIGVCDHVLVSKFWHM